MDQTIFVYLQVDTNRKWNREICDQFDKMATRLGEIPDKTRELVELQRYLKASMTETMPVMNMLILDLCNHDFTKYHNNQAIFQSHIHTSFTGSHV